MITLYTPATGFPDLEAKIAYGLARVGIEAYSSEKVKIIPRKGYYIISIEGEVDKLNETFNTLAKRILSSEYVPFSTPGIAGRSAPTIAVKETDKFDLNVYQTVVNKADNVESENFCRHKSKIKISNVLGFTAYATAGVLCKRDGVDITFYKGTPRRPTKPRAICKTCGLLALLGIWYASFIFSTSDEEIIVIPIPEKEITGSDLQKIFSLQHQIRKRWINRNLPQSAIPLIFLSQIPSSADILQGFKLFIALLSRQPGYHVNGVSLVSIGPILDFLRASSYNIAIVDTMLYRNSYGSLEKLSYILNYQKDKKSLSMFARLYVKETSTENWINLLYPETTKYLSKEVVMIKPEIIENQAIASLARTIRYFVRERKYHYADGIRNARKDSKDFEETIVKMLREGRLRLEQKEKIHLPNEDEIKEVFQLANENFDEIKTALVILALSFPTKKEEI